MEVFQAQNCLEQTNDPESTNYQVPNVTQDDFHELCLSGDPQNPYEELVTIELEVFKILNLLVA